MDRRRKLAEAYTAAWNAGSPQSVAGYFAEDGEIVINHGTPWRGRSGIVETANALTVHGWEEWDVSDDLKVTVSRGWYDSEDYARQVARGTA
jgi:uncharacterized protein (TIGR02246 family)